MNLTLEELQSLMPVIHAGAELLATKMGALAFVAAHPNLSDALAKLQHMADEGKKAMDNASEGGE